jgi:hypothetical protein
MIEGLFVLGGLTAMGLFGLAAVWLTPHLVVELGLGALGAGFVIGLPADLRYHVLLCRSLAARSAPPPHWWISLVEHHARLDRADLARITSWFFAGAIGFSLSCGGGLAAIAGLLSI